jgi:hypothetical protein
VCGACTVHKLGCPNLPQQAHHCQQLPQCLLICLAAALCCLNLPLKRADAFTYLLGSFKGSRALRRPFTSCLLEHFSELLLKLFDLAPAQGRQQK